MVIKASDPQFWMIHPTVNAQKKNIRRIDAIENEKLAKAFYATKQDFLLSGIPSEECYMFHGTHDMNIDSILSDNFRLDFVPTHKTKTAAFGEGIYLSEFPSVSLSYGTLILCRVLTGRVEVRAQIIGLVKI
jgi:hypothetical protein